MLASALTAVAMTAAVVGMIVGMAMIVSVTMIVQVLMLMGMGMIVAVSMVVRMGVGHTVMGMLVGMGMIMFMVVAAAGDVIVMNMHMVSPLRFSFIIPVVRVSVKTFIFAEISPHRACETSEKCV